LCVPRVEFMRPWQGAICLPTCVVRHAVYVWTSLREKFIVVLGLDRTRVQTVSTEELRSWLDEAGRRTVPDDT
jgi:hypothetical protein